jgi:stress-induced morphogen
MVNQVLEDEFKTGLHALAMKTMTPDEYEKKND